MGQEACSLGSPFRRVLPPQVKALFLQVTPLLGGRDPALVQALAELLRK